MPMKLYSRKQHGWMLKLVFLIDEHAEVSESEVYNIDSYAMVCFKSVKVKKNTNGRDEYYIRDTIGIKKHESATDVKVTMKVHAVVISREMHPHAVGAYGSFAALSCTESWTSWDIDTRPYKTCIKLLEIHIGLKVSKTEDPMKTKLYEDDQFTDFQLCAVDGCIGIHKAIMAIHSDMIKTMLGGVWRETVEKRIDVKGVTKQTLQHLKDYMYLGIVPQDGLHLRSLLLLSKFYLMNDLETKCTMKLIHTITAENLLDLLDFSRENNIPKLTFAILQLTPDKIIKSAYQVEMSKYLS